MNNNKIFTRWRCAVMIDGKRRYREFDLIGDVEMAYWHVLRTWGTANFRMVKGITKGGEPA